MKILLTGVAGFIGYHVAAKLVEQDIEIITLDIINDYYDINLKYDRLKSLGISQSNINNDSSVQSTDYAQLSFFKTDLTKKDKLNEIFLNNDIDVIIHLAAQAGVRYSLTNPHAYIDSNIIGFINILEMARHHKVKHLVYASHSSVYGMNENMPFSVHDNVDHPLSLYAASKKSNELMAHTYSHLYNVPTTGLRFLRFMAPGVVPIWLFLYLPKQFLKENRSKFSIMAICSEILHTLMI